MEGGKPTIITNVEGQRTTPSVVAYTKNENWWLNLRTLSSRSRGLSGRRCRRLTRSPSRSHIKW
ncbi:Stromal 70 kDa heat shock-related protein, chloroplastic [Linum perenne]